MLLFFLISSFLTQSFASVLNNHVQKYVVENQCQLPQKLKEEIKGYQPIVNQIVDNIVDGKYAGDTYRSLEEMTDLFGARLSGSQALEDSINYMVKQFIDAKLENVHTEEAEVYNWVRGSAYAALITPRISPLPVLALGLSVGTPKKGIQAAIVAVESFDELASLPDEEINGKIVVFVPKWEGYGSTVQYRSRGASEAAKRGAVAALIRSITPFSLGTLHTGMQSYEEGANKIPVACITVEDAERLLRLYKNGVSPVVYLRMNPRNLEPVISRNTIGELTGTDYKNTSVVVVSGHLDSWDVGVGAMDDGGGAFISWKALEYLKDMGLRPKRTLRAILWTGEEFGYLGAKAYEAAHKSQENEEFNFFMESDIGTFEPLGLDFTGNEDAECIFKEILNLMTPLNATQFDKPADGGPDISLWLKRGFPGASLLNKNEKYFWYHHSAADSMLVEDPHNLDKGTALFAAAAYVIADLSIDMPKDIYEFLLL